jgi:protein gp37
MGGKGGARHAGLTLVGHSGLEWTGEIRVRADLITWPLLQQRPRRILVDSTSDLFHEGLTTSVIDTLHAVMTIAHWHRFLVLTRRADRMRRYYADPHTPERVALEIDRLATSVLPTLGRGLQSPRGKGVAPPAASKARRGVVRQRWAAGLERAVHRAGGANEVAPRPVGLDPWPLPNLWPGVSVEDQEQIGRIADLLQMPAVHRWACFEPLLGPVRPEAALVDQSYLAAFGGGRSRPDQLGCMAPIAEPPWRSLDWVVAGGEVGAGARPTRSDWVRGLRDRCAAAGVPFFFKGWGEWGPEPDGSAERMVRVGRRGAGRFVDGRCWDEMPAALSRGGARRR